MGCLFRIFGSAIRLGLLVIAIVVVLRLFGHLSAHGIVSLVQSGVHRIFSIKTWLAHQFGSVTKKAHG